MRVATMAEVGSGLPAASGMSFNELVKTLDAQGMANFIQKTDDERKRQFDKDCAVLRKRLQKRRGFINPRRKHVQYWDLATALALLYTATVTPYEVGAGLKTEVGPLYIINTIVNFVFVVDILVQFVLPVTDRKTNELIR